MDRIAGWVIEHRSLIAHDEIKRYNIVSGKIETVSNVLDFFSLVSHCGETIFVFEFRPFTTKQGFVFLLRNIWNFF